MMSRLRDYENSNLYDIRKYTRFWSKINGNNGNDDKLMGASVIADHAFC
jgi:hypothetical protein